MKIKISKKEKGITLIALIISIIILLILAVVVINTAIIGNQGIISKSKEAALKYMQRQAEEEVALLMQEYAIENEEKGTTLENFLQGKKDDGVITRYIINSDGTAVITKGGYDVTVGDNGVTGSSTESITYTDSNGKTQELTKDTPVGTLIGTTTVDGQSVGWYLFDVSDDNKTAYLISTPTYWVPDTSKEPVKGALVPKLVSKSDSNTGALRQAIQGIKESKKYDSYPYKSSNVTYEPSDNTLKYFRSVNSKWSKKRGSIEYKKLNENEKCACYLADADIFAGIKNQVNSAEGNLNGKIKTLVGGASIEQWCNAYNKQAIVKEKQPKGGITCEYRETSYPGYIYYVNGTISKVSTNEYWTGDKTILGDNIYGAAYTNGKTSSTNAFYSDSWWAFASPSSGDINRICIVNGTGSYLNYGRSFVYNTRLSLFASVEL